MRVARGWWWLARGALCLPYAYGGVTGLLDFPGAVAEQANFYLQPASLFAAAVIVVQLGGSILVVFGKGYWRVGGAMTLALFTLVATFIGHAFWTMSGTERVEHLTAFVEHMGLVGGFMLVCAQALQLGYCGDEEEEEEEEED